MTKSLKKKNLVQFNIAEICLQNVLPSNFNKLFFLITEVTRGTCSFDCKLFHLSTVKRRRSHKRSYFVSLRVRKQRQPWSTEMQRESAVKMSNTFNVEIISPTQMFKIIF